MGDASLFKKQVGARAYAKVGLLGFAGSGKTYTASEMAIGLVGELRRRDLQLGARPVTFLDSEAGADWVAPRFAQADIELRTAHTRLFGDLISAMEEAEREASVLIVDSITHFWRDCCDAHARRSDRKQLQFSDWGAIKTEWAKFTDRYVNGALHVIICGRAAYEYEQTEDARGKKHIDRTAVKMKAESETGYEPSLLVLMERHMDIDSRKLYRTATVLKDRSTRLDGATFRNPTFESFRAHVEFLSLGGEQRAVETGHDSEGRNLRQAEQTERSIVLDEITEIIKRHHGGRSEAAKRERQALLERFFGTPSWKRVATLSLETLQAARDALWRELEGTDYEFSPPAPTADIDQEEAPT